MLAAFRCRLLGHRVNRNRVRFDGVMFRSRCRRCGSAMVRELDGWTDATGDRTVAANQA